MPTDQKYQNRSFIFIPFCYPDDALIADNSCESDDALIADNSCESDDTVSHLNFKELISKIGYKDDVWEPVEEKVRYMMKYVSDKYDYRNKEKCQGYHFILRPEARKENDIPSAESLYYTQKPSSSDSEQKSFSDNPFQIKEIHLFCFNTGVCIYAFELSMKDSDPMKIASAQFKLKNVSWNEIYSCKSKQATTFLNMATKLNEGFGLSNLECFYFANKGFERANFFTYIEVKEQENYRKELFYLRHCNSKTFCYKEDPELESREIFGTTSDVTWGVSSEAAVCLACPDMDNGNFVEEVMRKNFRTTYLFEYVLLLHQKYFLYLLMTRVGGGEYNKLKQLEKYDARINEFQTNFDYYCVTEVPQYQLLNQRVTEAFGLKKMEEDIKEPLIELRKQKEKSEEQKEKSEEKRAGMREKSLNTTITVIAFLAFFSALIDGFDFIGNFLDMYPAVQVRYVLQIILFIFILAVFVFVIVRLTRIFFKGRRESTNEATRKSSDSKKWGSAKQHNAVIKENKRMQSDCDYIYIGCFFSPEDLEEKIKPLNLNHLEKMVENPHVTFCFHPESVDETLFGKKIRVRIVSYAKDEKNEALGVELLNLNLHFIWLFWEYKKNGKPHITLSLSKDGKAVDSGKLNFKLIDYDRLLNESGEPMEPMEPIELEGTFGGFSKSGKVVTSLPLTDV